MEQVTGVLEAARDAYARRDWESARSGFRSARDNGELPVDDLAALADAAWWLGRTDEALTLLEEVYRRYLHGERAPRAAKLALDIGFLWLLRGEVAVGSGWIARARRLLEDVPDCVEQGYLLTLSLDEAFAAGDPDQALHVARDIQTIAQRFDDTTLGAVGLVGEGIALIRQGAVIDGMRVLDEAMLPVAAGDVDPDWAGNMYCRLMSVYHELADLPRARQWTDATERWCDRFSNAVMFIGICRIHRAQLLHVHGDWIRAEEEALRACEDLAGMNVEAVAEGLYQVGEIRRLRADLSGAEDAYRRAHLLGRDPQPGLALLRLAQGNRDAAAVSVAAALAASPEDAFLRARLLAAQVEIALASADLEVAAEASRDLAAVAEVYDSPGFRATSLHMEGAVLLGRDRPGDALAVLRQAYRRWQQLQAPHEAARVRVLLARSYRRIGDEDAARLEAEAATTVLEEIGATLDLTSMVDLLGPTRPPGDLTEREAEVLSCVAAGQTNRQIAAALFISEKTVARHLSNIFGKLEVSSRTEAAAYAFEHGLGPGPRR